MDGSSPASLSFTISRSLLKLMSIELTMPSNDLLHRPLLLPSFFHSIRVFFKEVALRIRWPKDRSFSFSTSPSNEYSGLISFRMDWFDFLEVQGTLKSLLLLQHHSSKASILWCSALWSTSHIQTRLSRNYSFGYMDLCRQSDISAFNTLYRFIIAFLPRNSFPDLELVCCSMSSSNCCFLTCIQISQEAGQVVWYSHLLKNFP